MQPCRYRSISSDGEGWRVSLRVGEAELECRPRAIIAADGEHSSLRRDLSGSRRRAEEWLAVRAYLGGLSEPVPQMSFHFTRDVLPGYGWVFPAGSQEGGFRANAGVYVHSERLRRGGHSLKELFRRFVEPLVESPSAPLHGARLESEPQGYPITPYNPARRLVFRNALLAGDAAGVADPLTGEGIGPAILSGRLAAEAAARFVSSGAAIDLLRYADELKRALDPTRRRGRFLLYLLERHSWLVDRLFVRAESDRRLADRVFRVLSGDLPLRRVFRPSVFLRIYWPGLFR